MSLTKTYVATVVLQLAGEGKLSLGDTVERWLPGLVPASDRITIRQLRNHSSGVPEFDQDSRVLKPYLAGNLHYHWSPQALVRIAVSHKRQFAPGARYAYSNTDYLLVGLIVEAATGRSLAAELAQRLFIPLNLKTTSFQTRPGLVAPCAHGYYVFEKPPATDISGLSPYAWAAGAIVAKAADIATFYRALLRGKLLPAEELREMTTTLSEGSNTDLPGSRYGLGLESLLWVRKLGSRGGAVFMDESAESVSAFDGGCGRVRDLWLPGQGVGNQRDGRTTIRPTYAPPRRNRVNAPHTARDRSAHDLHTPRPG